MADTQPVPQGQDRLTLAAKIGPALLWFGLACYVIYRCVSTVGQEQLDIIFAAWLGGVISFQCVVVIIRLSKERKR